MEQALCGLAAGLVLGHQATVLGRRGWLAAAHYRGLAVRSLTVGPQLGHLLQLLLQLLQLLFSLQVLLLLPPQSLLLCLQGTIVYLLLLRLLLLLQLELMLLQQVILQCWPQDMCSAGCSVFATLAEGLLHCI